MSICKACHHARPGSEYGEFSLKWPCSFAHPNIHMDGNRKSCRKWKGGLPLEEELLDHTGGHFRVKSLTGMVTQRVAHVY